MHEHAARGLRAAATCFLTLSLFSALGVGAGMDDDERAVTWPRGRGGRFDGVAIAPGALSEPLKRTLGSGYSGVAAAEASAVTLVSDGTADYVVALDAETGAERWRVAIAPTYPGREGAMDGPVSTPAIDDGTVFALGPRGDLLAVGLASGEIEWQVDLVDHLGASTPHWGFGTSPLVYGDLVIVAGGGAEGGPVTAFDRDTGEPRWRAGSDDFNYQSPILTKGAPTELIAAGDRALFGLDPATGRELWRFEHGGERFYRRIINPVEIAPDSFLITYRPEQALLFRVEETGGARRIVPQWTTRHLKLNYATPVLSGNYLYGYSGRFLTCVDARSGELVWKSRAPGDGFPIVVDGHLVILTKKGDLHVAEASPSGYREKATLELFSRLAWTPPSFAYGRVYARDSFGDVASVDIVKRGPTTAAEPSSPLGKIPESEFARWIRTLEQAPDKPARIRRWITEQTAFPVIEKGRWVHYVYVGEAKDLAIKGDMLEAGDELTMFRVGGTDLLYASFELEADARINYQFVRNMDERLPDPRNPRRAPSLVYSGETSQLLMPLAERPTVSAPAQVSSAGGTLDSFALESKPVRVGAKTWGGTRRVRVYLPSAYAAEHDRSYPVIYVLYGERMLRGARLKELLDAYIGSRISPVIAVFVQSISPYEYARSQRDVHARMIVDDLVPLIDRRYRTRGTSEDRVIAGVDEGAYAALSLALDHSDVFGRVSVQSVLPIGNGGEVLLEKIASSGARLDVYLDWGRYDQRNPSDGTDVPAYSRRLYAALQRKGHNIRRREWNDGSDLAIWGMRFGPALESFFASAPAARDHR
jgi:outer membrane protein assembly factor BamB/enterochelin esterase-like enzyme